MGSLLKGVWVQNKNVLITGGTGGIGYQTALKLAKLGARVIVTGRSRSPAEEAVIQLKQASGNPDIHFLLADLSILSNVHTLAEEFLVTFSRLDVLINNAGLAAPNRQLTTGGIEANFAVNVIAPFLLTRLLLGALEAGLPARVISLAGGSLPACLQMDNLQAEHSFDGLDSYSQTKLAMMAVMLEFARRTQDTPLAINVCYPGQASTTMTRGVIPEMLPGAMRWMFPLFRWLTRPDGGKSAARASRSSVYLASAAEVQGVTGKFFNSNCQEVKWPQAVLDMETRHKLWERLEHLTQAN